MFHLKVDHTQMMKTYETEKGKVITLNLMEKCLIYLSSKEITYFILIFGLIFLQTSN